MSTIYINPKETSTEPSGCSSQKSGFRGDAAPAVSVIVTCYNYGRYLSDALASVRDQSFGDWECIIVNDGSLDDTCRIASEWASRDSRFRYAGQSNSGVSSARNRGLSLSRGRYIQILDADDILAAEKFRTQVDMLDILPDSSLAYSSYELLYEVDYGHRRQSVSDASLIPQRAILDSLIRDWERSFSIPPHCFLFRRCQLEEVDGFAIELETHEDIDLYIKLAHSGVDFIHHCDVLAIYRRHANSMCQNRLKMARGYLLALGRASDRASKLRYQLLSVWRYVIELERFFTTSMFQGQGIAAVRVVLSIRYLLFSALGVTLYPILLGLRMSSLARRLLDEFRKA